MEIRHIKELMAAMGRTGTKRLTFKKEGIELQLERDIDGHVEQSLELLDELPGNEPDAQGYRCAIQSQRIGIIAEWSLHDAFSG